MDKFGIIKEFDTLGRIVIPKKLREQYFKDGAVEIIATREGLSLQSPEYFLVERRPIESEQSSEDK